MLVLRPADPSDIPTLVAIEHQAGGHGRWQVSTFTEELRTAWSHTWVVQHEGGIAGFMVVWRVADEVQLLNIAVAQACQGRGFAKHMLNALHQWAQAQHLQKISLELRRSNTVALRLYQRCGFVVVGQRPRYYADTDEDALLMETTL